MEQVQSEADVYPDHFGRASIVLFGLGVMLMTVLLSVWRIKQDYDQTREASRAQLSLFATALGKQVEALVRDSVGAATAGALSMRAADTAADCQQVLQNLLKGDDYLRALFALKDGNLVFATRDGAAVSADSLPSPEQLRHAANGVWFGKVTEGDSGSLILPVARRISAAMRAPATGGEVWAGAFLRIGELDSVFGYLKELDSNAALVTLGGIGLIQLPLSDTSVRNVDISGTRIYSKFQQQREQQLTLMIGPDVNTSKSRLYAMYRIQGIPGIAVSSSLISDIFKEWRKRTNALVLFVALLSAAAVALAVRLQILYNRRMRSLQQLAAARGEAAEARHAELTARRTMTRDLLVAQERDRQRLAGELHDSVGQHLSMLRNHAVQLKRTAVSDETREHAESLIDLASEAIEEVRAVAHNLRPVHLEELGLSSALTVMLDRIELSSGLSVQSRIENVDDLLQGEAASHVYRIVQEATNNVLRHADASTMWVDVVHHEKSVTLSVRDDGRGLDAPSETGPPGLGMTSIGERATILGATLTVRPNEPMGHCLEVSIPGRAA